MCLIFIALKRHPRYKFVVAANRDEFYHRRTAVAGFWDDFPSVVAGRDLEAGGTWLGMSTAGKVSMITNFRDPKNINPSAPSRGALVSDFLIGDVDPVTYMTHVEKVSNEYNGFNLLVGDTKTLYYHSNYSEGVRSISEGLFGLSNHLLETPWPKVVKGKRKMDDALKRDDLNPEHLFEVLSDEQVASDESLPDTGIGIERERALSSMFIKTPGYGTRCSTVILVDNLDNVLFTERVYDLNTFSFTTSTFEFRLL